MKRKIAISTLAASMAVTAFAGIPLSSKGLAEKVGIQVNVASAAELGVEAPEFKNKINRIHSALSKAPTAQIQSVRDLRDAISTLEDDQLQNIIAPIWNKIEPQIPQVDRAAVNDALTALITAAFGSVYDENLTALEAIRNNEEIREGLEALAAAGGEEDLDVLDVIKFIEAAERAISANVTSLTQVANLVDGVGRTQLIREVAVALRNDDNKVSKILASFDDNTGEGENITVENILQSYNNFINAPGVAAHYEDATKALVAAYLRSESTATPAYSNNGLTASISTVRLLNVPVAAAGLEWVSSNALIQVNRNADTGVVTFTSTNNQSATVTAALDGYIIFEAPIALNYVNPNPGPGPVFPGPGTPVTPPPTDPGTETPPVDVPGVIDAVIDELDDILADLEGASPSERAEIIAEAIDAAVVAIDKIANYNAASSVNVANGVATLNVSDADVLAIINGISDIKSKLESLAPGSTNELTPRVIAIHLGAISEDQVSVNISQALFTAARTAGLGGFEIVADRLSVTLPASNSFAGGAVNLSVERETPNGEPAVEGIRTASQIYSFDVTVGGNAVTTFDRQVILKIPVVNTDGLDEELLSLAKIVNGGLEIHGGFLRGGFIVEPRDSFSSYVIVENTVSFNDINSVTAWAGRQIQVMAAKGAVQGRAEGQFVPRDNVTRAEFAKMLVRAMNLENNSATHSFSDVNSGDWFAPYVAAAADLGIINGRSATSFAPNALITRAEMATMLARTLSITHELEAISDVDGALAAFIDGASIHSTLRSGVALAASKELIIGYQGNFMPNDNATRAEAAVMVYRAFNFTE